MSAYRPPARPPIERRVLQWSEAQWCTARGWARGHFTVPPGDDIVAAQDLQAAWRLHWTRDPQPSRFVTADDREWAAALMRLARDTPESQA